MHPQESSLPEVPIGPAFEQHFTPKELAERWHLGVDTVREMFENELGVIRLERPETLHKRRYNTMRIPESVARRVHQKWSSKSKRVQ